MVIEQLDSVWAKVITNGMPNAASVRRTSPEAAAARRPSAGYLHTLTFLQARGGLRTAQGRFSEALDDLRTAGRGWRELGVSHPAIASWRTDAAAAHAALGHQEEAASLAAEQLALARRVGTPITLGVALRAYAAAAARDQAEECLAEAVRLLESTPARLDLAYALTDLGSLLRRHGRRTDARRFTALSTSPTGPVRHNWPNAPVPSSSPPGPGPAGPRSPARTRSPLPKDASPGSRHLAGETVRSRSSCSSPCPPSKPTCGTSTANSASPPGPGSRAGSARRPARNPPSPRTRLPPCETCRSGFALR